VCFPSIALIFGSAANAAQWVQTYHTGLLDWANAAQPTADGGYIVVGFTNFFNTSGFGAWVLKLDSSGNIVWQRVYDSSGDAILNAVQQTSDGGYIVAGHRNPDFAITGRDGWVLKLDANGNVLWQRTYGSSGFDDIRSLERTRDGGHVAAGYTESFGAGGGDAWVLKIDATGNIVWQKTYGSTAKDQANSIRSTQDGGYVMAGRVPAALARAVRTPGY